MTSPFALRKEILAARDTMSREQLQEKSRVIGQKLLASDEIINAENIFIYVNFRSEVETLSIIRQLLAGGKQVSVPVTRVAEKKLDIVVIKDPDKELRPGYCNIPEPPEELVKTRSVTPQTLDTVILPGSVFDEKCGRFGYGGGFYDRLLSQIPGASRVALAFEIQIVTELPLQNHDEILDCIITEKRTIRNASRQH